MLGGLAKGVAGPRSGNGKGGPGQQEDRYGATRLFVFKKVLFLDYRSKLKDESPSRHPEMSMAASMVGLHSVPHADLGVLLLGRGFWGWVWEGLTGERMTWADRLAERMKAATLAAWEERQLAKWRTDPGPPGWGAHPRNEKEILISKPLPASGAT